LQLAVELFDLLAFGTLVVLELAAIVEGKVRVFEEQPLSVVEDRGTESVLIAQVGDGRALDQMAFEDGALLLGRQRERLLT
jgi:hypothetical protein